MALLEKLTFAQNYFKNRKVLVTGGNGFIGSYLVDRLKELGASVKIYDLTNRYNGDVDFVFGDIRDYDRLYASMKNIDIVFHFAAILGVERIINIPDEVLEINLGGTRNAIRAAQEHNVEKFMFSSSSEIYGNPRTIPIREDADPAPISVYGISKLAGEAYCRTLAEKSDTKVIIFRFFNVYGPRQVEKFVMSNFISRVSQNLPPIIYGSGKQSRCYTFVSDAINGVLLASALSEKKIDIYNIGNDRETTVSELADLIIEFHGRKLLPEYRAFGEGVRVEKREIIRRKPSIEKAKSNLGFEIKTLVQEGIRRYFEWYYKEHELRKLVNEMNMLEKRITIPQYTRVGASA
ncbi:MAG: NAD-dependent epimerase/dehydratase family protein [Candidatus Zixiibacteriota bacterium]